MKEWRTKKKKRIRSKYIPTGWLVYGKILLVLKRGREKGRERRSKRKSAHCQKYKEHWFQFAYCGPYLSR